MTVILALSTSPIERADIPPSLKDTQAAVKATIEQVGQEMSAIGPGVVFDWRRTASRAG